MGSSSTREALTSSHNLLTRINIFEPDLLVNDIGLPACLQAVPTERFDIVAGVLKCTHGTLRGGQPVKHLTLIDCDGNEAEVSCTTHNTYILVYGHYEADCLSTMLSSTDPPHTSAQLQASLMPSTTLFMSHMPLAARLCFGPTTFQDWGCQLRTQSESSLAQLHLEAVQKDNNSKCQKQGDYRHRS